jgi:poly(hydroxyalkanoate) granule-associated protein
MASKRSRKTPGSSSRRRPRAGFGAAAAGAQAAQEQLKQSLQQVLLAGMGVIARAQKEGPVAFQDAVVEGLKALGETGSTAQRRVRDVFESAQETLQSRVGDARGQAQETWDSLEALFQSRVQRAMHQLGVPTAAEIRDLSRRVSELNDTVLELDQPQRPARKAGRRKAAAPVRARAKAKSKTRAKTKRSPTAS